MKIRKRCLPRTPADCGAFIFVFILIPTTYFFELFIVMPTMYTMWSFWYSVHFIMGTFLMTNITSNFVAIVLTDTSISGELMPSTMEPNCRFCAVCETIAPPRSWHCNVCQTCILKRDHHCMFTGCCIGHYNLRYFIMFIFYVFIGALYATYFNSFFLWRTYDFRTPFAIMKVIFPMAMLAFGVDASETQLYLLISLINIVGMLFTCALWVHNVNLLIKGRVSYEKNHNISDYDLGTKQNIIEVFGEKWYISWLFPFIVSDLPHNGIKWYTADSWKSDGMKTK